MKFSERVTAVISVLALIVSGYSLYQSHQNSELSVRMYFAEEIEKNLQLHLQTVEKLHGLNDIISQCLELEKEKEKIILLADLREDGVELLDNFKSQVEAIGQLKVGSNQEELFALKSVYANELANVARLEQIIKKANLMCESESTG